MEGKMHNYSGKYLECLLRGNRSACSRLVHRFLKENNSINDLYENVLKVALYDIGVLWENNKISVATEHLATAITEGILNELFEQIISTNRFNRKVVLTCVENERHQVGIKMVADVYEMQGWESYFLGTGIPTHELKRYLREEEPEILAISLSIYFNYKKLIHTIEAVRADFPNLLIIVGGQAFNHVNVSALEKIDKVFYFHDLYVLEQFIKSINKDRK
ncbi:cobalamin-dependent protein [uncultured Draconibacterium sp.]|uniref:cobalamin B12-binding domain-containing protein n=1 Tax=uncultured Draconibacterium sp. TaxID=1573823 RepID=UPI00326011CE